MLSLGDTIRVHGRVMLPGMIAGDWRVTEISGEPAVYFLTRGDHTLRFWFSEVDPLIADHYQHQPATICSPFGASSASGRLELLTKPLCPDCNQPVWDVATIDQRLNKCWSCGLRFDSPEPDDDDDGE